LSKWTPDLLEADDVWLQLNQLIDEQRRAIPPAVSAVADVERRNDKRLR
jgi:hypothetical protein